MPNERLRALLLERRVTPAKLAEAVEVDPKTIERWIIAGRVPYRRHRYAVAAFFAVDESYIWPVPRDAWGHLFEQASREIGILVYSAHFMAEDAGLKQMLASKAKAGAR